MERLPAWRQPRAQQGFEMAPRVAEVISVAVVLLREMCDVVCALDKRHFFRTSTAQL